MHDLEAQWAHQTFSHANLGDPRRTRRLVEVAAAVARKPGGTVTSVMKSSAMKEGAFRLLENAKVDAKQIAEAVHIATALSCAEFERVYIALDQSSICFVDRHDVRGLGKIGSSRRIRGLQVMTGLAVAPDGTPIGICAMRWFSRPDHPTGWGEDDLRPVEDRESGLWLDALDDIAKVFSKYAPMTKLCVLIDRGGDFWRVFDLAREHGFDVIVRAGHNRVIKDEDGPAKLLEAVSTARVVGRMELCRKNLRAKLAVRARPVTVMMADCQRPRQAFDLWIVRVHQVGKTQGEPIVWNLLTTLPATNLPRALEVVRGYTMRWRVEEFHRAWKGGHCKLERSQLRSPAALQRWSIILAAVATRIERLKQLSRTHGDADALVELTRDEIDAAIVLSETKRWKVGDTPSLAEIVMLIAQIGGYTGKSSGGPPGATTIGRGMDWVTPAARMAKHLRPTCG